MPATRTSKQTTGKASAPTAAKSKAKKIPRPENSFILYRKDRALSYKEEHPELFPMKIGPLSKIIGLLWKEEPADVRRDYETLAAVKLEEHKVMYPGYKYHPTPKAQKEAKKEEAAARKARVEEAKAARVASQTSARARSTPKTPSEAAVPVPGPWQVAAPRRKSRRTAAPSTSAVGPSGARTQVAAALPGMGQFTLSPDSDAESRLSSATPSQEFDGETLRRLPFPLQATAAAFVPTPSPDDVQYAAPSFQAPVIDTSHLPELVQGSSPQVQIADGALFQSPAMASPALPSGSESDPLGLSRVWYGLPPRDILDPAFPAHLPPAGLVEPIDLQDVVFALDSAQETGVAWMAHAPQMVPDVAPSEISPVPGAYDFPPANGSGALGPTMDMAEVHQAADQSSADASDACTLEDALDQMAAEADTWELPSMPISMELVDFAVERFFATPGVPMEPSL